MVVCALALATAAAAPARANEPIDGAANDDKIVTVVAASESALLERLAQEMSLAGLSVARSKDPPEVRSKLVIVIPDDPQAAIEIWTVANATSTLAVLVPAGGPDDTRALRVAELARALVVSPSFSPEPPPGPAAVVAPAAAVSPPPAPPHRVSRALDAVVVDPKPSPREVVPFDFGLATAIGFQAPGVSMQIEATATYWPHELVGVGFFGSAPVVAATMESSGGTAAVRSALFAAELATAPLGRSHEMFTLLLNPGFAFDYLHVIGEGQTPDQNRTVDKPLAATYGRAELRARIAGPVSLKASAFAGAAFPPVEIRFFGRVVSTFCPLGAASLGVVVEP
jgi:hypothetical protein